MLNIPDTVKALFKRDGVQKNFRVHFPNGEFSDITNENIVQESVKFTESMCSQDVLKFGMTEASVIEFETVGIGNMYGMTIECGIEIDLSSLSAADLATIAAGTWDGTYVAVGDSDIGYAYFRVPYGKFRVESCQRDHQAMAHRKVQAFSVSPTNLQMTEFEKNKLNIFSTESAYTPDLYKLFLSQSGHNNPQVLYDAGFTDGSVITQEYPSNPLVARQFANEITVTCNGVQHTVKGRVSYNRAYTYKDSYVIVNYGVDRDKMYALDYNGYSPDTILENAIAAMKANATLAGIDLEASGFSSWEDFALNLYLYYTSGNKAIKLLYPQAAFAVSSSQIQSQWKYNYFTISEEDKAIYTRIGDETYDYNGVTWEYTYCSFMVPFKFEIIMDTSTTVYDETISNVVQVKQYNDPVSLLALSAQFPPTLVSGNYHSFSNSYSLTEIMNGLMELVAMFGRINRNGNLVTQRITKSNPITVQTGEYSQFWWDEYEVLPVGAVEYLYTDSDGNENTKYYYFGTGESVYDMTGNEVLKVLTNQTESTVEDLLDTYFIPNLLPLSFTPIDLAMKGLPYIEAGDYLAVVAEDGTIAYSFDMKQDINGIQMLTADIESTSGDIIESGESV